MDNNSKIKLELGVGEKKKIENSIGVDIRKTKAVDIIFDLNHSIFPFKNDTIDEVYCFHILEHLDDMINVMNEIHRICKNGAKVIISGPHYTCNWSFADPTHKRGFSLFTFDYFAVNPTVKTQKYTDRKFKIIKKRLQFGGKPPIRTLKNIIFNRFPYFYERALAFIFPCTSVYFELEVVK